MKAAVVRGPGQLSLEDLPMPTMGPYDALVRIEACSICNATDIKIIDRHFVTRIPVPLVLGHESVGTVLEVGKRVRGYHPGQRVLRPGAVYSDPSVGMASAWGGLAEYGLVTDLRAWRQDHPDQVAPNGMWAKQQIIPSELDPAEATAIITLKETLYATRAAGVDHTTWTAIVGTGPVARALTFWSRHEQAPFVVVFGRNERWCHDFLDLGANNYVAGDKPCREDEAKVAGVQAFDRVIEAVGSVEAIHDALTLARPDGLVACYGVLPDSEHEDELIQSARAAGRLITLPVREEEMHAEVLKLIDQGVLDLSAWISHRMPFEALNAAIQLVRNKRATKVVLEL
ncbi:MAG: alcohol dehydrogenase catalytic domain-containing protein [Anaerolineae bacterium]|nr:alcohol dehydrogenase catalytic domain-containing protein [Anaerolineae bacterium]